MVLSLRKQIIELRKSGLKYDEIRLKLKCAKSTISYHCKVAGLNSDNINRKPTDEEIKIWQDLYNTGLSANKIAKKVEWCTSTIRHYIKTRTRIIRTLEEKQKLNVSRVLIRRQKVKKLLVEYKGGKCERCGYNKCIRALEFHHINPLEKKYQMSKVSNSFDILKKEADKCMLVCANCHREIEEENFKINNRDF